MPEQRTVLIVGAYGLVGSAAARRLSSEGWRVVGLGRSKSRGLKALPADQWITADLASLTQPDAWNPHLQNVDAVVNASGALQDGPGCALEDVHATSLAALAKACAACGVERLVQISAPGASPDASTAFLRTKAVGDAAVREFSPRWTILRPALIVGDVDYGGIAALRMLAATPWVCFAPRSNASLRTVALDDVAAAVSRALEPDFPRAVDAVLAEQYARTLPETLMAIRAGFGLAAPKRLLLLPHWAGVLGARAGDVAHALGWRTAVSSTAVRALADAPQMEPEEWRRIAGVYPAPLEASLPVGAVRRVQLREARTALLRPLMFLSLAALWLASGAASLLNFSEGMALLAPSGLSVSTAQGVIVVGGLVDLLLGALILYRPFAAAACLGMAAVTAGYLLAATWLTPWLWGDPLQPLTKALPAAVLALAALVQLEKR